VKEKLSDRFHMTDLSPCSHYLGMHITRDRQNRTLRLSQKAYLEKVLADLGLSDCAPVCTPMDQSKLQKAEDGYEAPWQLRTTYQSAAGSLMYAMLGTRPDIAFAVSVISRYASNPAETHWKAVKRILRYLKGSIDLQLTYRGSLKPLTGYTDSDWAGDHDTRRSTSRYIFNLRSGAISWSSKRQATVALSTCEAEYIGQTQAAKEAIWLRRLLQEIEATKDSLSATIIYGDN